MRSFKPPAGEVLLPASSDARHSDLYTYHYFFLIPILCLQVIMTLFTASVADATLAELLQAHLFQVFVGRFGTPAGRKTMNESEVGDVSASPLCYQRTDLQLCHALGLVVDPEEMIALYGKHGDNMFLQVSVGWSPPVDWTHRSVRHDATRHG